MTGPELLARWRALAAWSSGCGVEDLAAAEREVRPAICHAQGLANIKGRLRECGPDVFAAVDRWAKTELARVSSDERPCAAPELLATELGLVEACAAREGFTREQPKAALDVLSPFRHVASFVGIGRPEEEAKRSAAAAVYVVGAIGVGTLAWVLGRRFA